MISQCAAEQSSNPVDSAKTGDAPPKEPLTEAQADKAAEPASSEITQPLEVVPEPQKPADTPAANTNGTATGVNGTSDKVQSLAPEESKQSSASTADKSADKITASDDAPTVGNVAEATSDPVQPPVMTGALPLDDQAEQGPASTAPVESIQEDGVKEVPTTAAEADEPDTNGTEKRDDEVAAQIVPTAVADEKKDVDMKDAGPVESSTEQKDVEMKDSAPKTITASAAADGTDVSATSTANDVELTGAKRKATNGQNGAATAEEPAEKKQKGLADKVVTKAKEVVEEVKEKATPTRKNSKKAKKEQAPIGRTERKTRSQGRAE